MRRLSLGELLSSPREVAGFRELLGRGGVAALPTETSYALGADPANEHGVSRIFRIKRRDDRKPLPVLFSSREQLEELGVSATPQLFDRFMRIWPAPLTVVLALDRPIAASRGSRTLAVRIPAADAVRRLLDAVGPLTGTSANRSGQPPASDPDAVTSALGEDLDLLIDGGPTSGGAPSTIVDATREPPVVLRRGPVPWPPPETSSAC
jgi:L-threonylcarbamoyladenylate synthase